MYENILGSTLFHFFDDIMIALARGTTSIMRNTFCNVFYKLDRQRRKFLFVFIKKNSFFLLGAVDSNYI